MIISMIKVVEKDKILSYPFFLDFVKIILLGGSINANTAYR